MRHKEVEYWAAWAFGLLAVLTVGLQILASAQQNTPGPVVTTLFNILQFIFSILFSWLVTRIVTRKEFAESQKRFATSAYRRILDIRDSFEHLKRKLAEKSRQSTLARVDFEVVESMTFAIEQTISSSISDWGEIIGAEIARVNQVEQLRAERDSALAREAVSKTKEEIGAEFDAIMASYKERIEHLKSELPLILRTSPALEPEAAETRKEAAAWQYAEELRAKISRGEDVEFSGFWDDTFERDILTVKAGDNGLVRIGSARTREAILVFVDSDDKSVGLLINESGGRYHHFVSAVQSVLGEKFGVVVSEIERVERVDKRISEHERHYFKVRAVVQPDRMLPQTRAKLV